MFRKCQKTEKGRLPSCLERLSKKKKNFLQHYVLERETNQLGFKMRKTISERE